MQQFKVINRNIKPTTEQMTNYRQSHNHQRNTNLRFGKIIILSDQDLDG
jgi:DNA gyrase/topoisomerase IV subunit B